MCLCVCVRLFVPPACRDLWGPKQNVRYPPVAEGVMTWLGLHKTNKQTENSNQTNSNHSILQNEKEKRKKK